jgi:hypothetical protein
MNTSSIKLLMTEGLMAAYVRDHSTTPEVVNISKVSSIFGFGKEETGRPSGGFVYYYREKEQAQYAVIDDKSAICLADTRRRFKVHLGRFDKITFGDWLCSAPPARPGITRTRGQL